MVFDLNRSLIEGYIDGNLMGSTTYLAKPANNSFELFSNYDRNQRPDGFVAEVLIYKTALSLLIGLWSKIIWLISGDSPRAKIRK